MTKPSEDLLTRFNQGDAAAFAELVELFGPRLKGFFLRKGVQASTAEDLSQHVFIRLYNSASRYQARGRFDSFCFQVAHNIFLDHCRSKKVTLHGDGIPEQSDERTQASEQVESRDRDQILRKILAEQDDETRELLELAVLQRLAYSDVSAILDIPVGTVKSRVHYALRRMRGQFKKYEQDF
jgi:RNA polymerase sigma-70 factor (ECF subfamily)